MRPLSLLSGGDVMTCNARVVNLSNVSSCQFFQHQACRTYLQSCYSLGNSFAKLLLSGQFPARPVFPQLGQCIRLHTESPTRKMSYSSKIACFPVSFHTSIWFFISKLKPIDCCFLRLLMVHGQQTCCACLGQASSHVALQVRRQEPRGAFACTA